MPRTHLTLATPQSDRIQGGVGHSNVSAEEAHWALLPPTSSCHWSLTRALILHAHSPLRLHGHSPLPTDLPLSHLKRTVSKPLTPQP